MSIFNSDVFDRLAVAVDLANASAEGVLPGDGSRRPTWIFESHRYQGPAEGREWDDLAVLARRVSSLLRLIVSDDHDIAVDQVNRWLQEQHALPFVERQNDRWVLHFHTPCASFTQGWAGGIAAAIALSYSTGDAPRIGSCAAMSCTRHFLDRGRNQQRRFCSLRCQNRAKAASYRRRHTIH